MSDRISKFCKWLDMDQGYHNRPMVGNVLPCIQDVTKQDLNKSVADLLSSDDEKDTSKHRAFVESEILKREDIDSIKNYNSDKLQVVFWKNPSWRKSDKNEMEQFYSWTRWEEFKILYIDSLTKLRRIIISRKGIVRKNLSELEINTDIEWFTNDNDEIIKKFIEYINIKLGKNIYQELREIYQEETSERVDSLVNKVYDRNLSEIHKKRLSNDWDKWKKEIPKQELDEWQENQPDEKSNKWLWLNDFNILVQEWKIDIKTFQFIINLLNNKLKVNIINLYYLCKNWIINKLTSSKINESKLIELINKTFEKILIKLINNADIEKLIELINNVHTEKLIILINYAYTKKLIWLINNVDTEKLIILINNTDSEKLSILINNADSEKLSILINTSDTKKLSILINTADIEDLSNLINTADIKKLSNLINTADIKKLSGLINFTDIKKLSELINTTDIKKLSELINLIKTWELWNLINNTIMVNLNRAIEKDFDQLIVYLNWSKYMIHNRLYMNVKYFR